MNKRAEMGIGTLIIFIAMILVAAIAAGVLIQTATSLQNKALLTGERSKGQVSTSILTMILFGEDGGDNDVEVFCQKVKLAPGSDPIRFSDTLITFNTKNASSDMTAGNRTMGIDITAVPQPSGIDFDGDGAIDTIALNGAFDSILLGITNGTGGAFTATIPLGAVIDGTGPLSRDAFNLSILNAAVNNSDGRIGSLTVALFRYSGNGVINTSLEDNVYVIGSGGNSTGAYSIEYLIEGDSYQNGYLQRGDVAKLCYGGPRAVTEDEAIMIMVIPKIGNPMTIETAIPDVMTEKRIILFP
jgi:flagellin-like protein